MVEPGSSGRILIVNSMQKNLNKNKKKVVGRNAGGKKKNASVHGVGKVTRKGGIRGSYLYTVYRIGMTHKHCHDLMVQGEWRRRRKRLG